MKVSELYGPAGPIFGQDVYVVGLGPSMSVFPLSFLVGRTCVLLNDAQRFFPALGPVAFSNHRAFVEPRSESCRFSVVKGRLKSDPNPERADNHVPWDHPTHHVFSYRSHPHDPIDCNDESCLFLEPDFYWRGPVAVFACQFALLAGVRSITLVGCDCAPIGGADYFSTDVDAARRALSKSSGRRSGKKALHHNYEAYASGLLRVKKEADKRFGVPIMTLTPFMGLADPADQLRAIARWRSPGSSPPTRAEKLEARRQRRIADTAAARRNRRALRSGNVVKVPDAELRR